MASSTRTASLLRVPEPQAARHCEIHACHTPARCSCHPEARRASLSTSEPGLGFSCLGAPLILSHSAPRAELGGTAGCRAASNTPLLQRGKAPGTSVRTEKPNVTQDTELKLKPPRFCLKSRVLCAPVTRNDKVIANISQASQRSRSNKEHEKQLCKQSLSPGSAAQARLCPSAPGGAGKTPPARPGCSHQAPPARAARLLRGEISERNQQEHFHWF